MRTVIIITVLFLLGPLAAFQGAFAEAGQGTAVPSQTDTSKLIHLSPDKIRAIRALQPSFEAPGHNVDKSLINWLKSNTSPITRMPLSFYTPEQLSSDLFSQMGEINSVPGIIERNIVRDGLVIYDCALWQIVLISLGGKNNLELAMLPVRYFWEGGLADLSQIRAGYKPQSYVYDPQNPDLVSADQNSKGKRGFIFRIINAHGRYLMLDPYDRKSEFKGFPNFDRIHWEDWKPIAGENAWVVMAALHLYHKKYFDPQRGTYSSAVEEPIELALAEELARAAIILQAENGGVRMAPLGTYHNPEYDPINNVWLAEPGRMPADYSWHYNEISTENNLSWYAAFRMLYQVTADEQYKFAMEKIEQYLEGVWNSQEHVFYQGMHYIDGRWTANGEHFAVDVQNLTIAVMGAEWLDKTFGEGQAFRVWSETKKRGGFRLPDGSLAGVGFTDENDRLSIEWTGMAILATKTLASYYKTRKPEFALESELDNAAMRRGIEDYKFIISDKVAAYSYSSRRGWIPFGWFSHSPEILSLAATCWTILNEMGVNPFLLQ